MSRVRTALGLLAWVVLGAAVASAADDAKVFFPGGSGTSASGAAAPGSGSLGNMTLVIGLVLAAVGGWFVWRGRLNSPVSRDNRLLALSETKSLGNRQYLVVATYDNKKFLLGVCPGRIDMLAPLHDAAPTEGKSRP